MSLGHHDWTWAIERVIGIVITTITSDFGANRVDVIFTRSTNGGTLVPGEINVRRKIDKVPDGCYRVITYIWPLLERNAETNVNKRANKFRGDDFTRSLGHPPSALIQY